MITAKEAAIRSRCNKAFKKEISKIEGFINDAIENGRYGIHYATDGFEDDLLSLLTEHLGSLGYEVEYRPPRELPIGCPVDQWDFSAYLAVSWEVEK